ncbi:hypothetical protein HMPREF0208_02696 [Citrobacter koseri]|nr:hypothetical protein HMPREF3220_03964 [Citrobacter koseri]KXA03730.1 hypothetical protein HMPREF3207_01620 [Citrobacter koseri]KXB43305.1 hypothetical protein HMPREF0208_02696 [Citrobacter koseri]
MQLNSRLVSFVTGRKYIYRLYGLFPFLLMIKKDRVLLIIIPPLFWSNEC